MEDRKLLHSLMEGVLIIYNEQKALNETKHLLDGDNITAVGPLMVTWRLVLLMMTIWFLSILSWVALSLHLGKMSAQQSESPPKPHEKPKDSFAPNYHTHFHCNCNKQHELRFSDENLFSDVSLHQSDNLNLFSREAAAASRSDSDDLSHMQIATPATNTYEIAV